MKERTSVFFHRWRQQFNVRVLYVVRVASCYRIDVYNMCLSRRDEIVGHIYNEDNNNTIDIDNTTVDDISNNDKSNNDISNSDKNNNDKNSNNTFKAMKTLAKSKSNF